MHREREALRARSDALQMTLLQSQGRDAVAREASPASILRKARRAGWGRPLSSGAACRCRPPPPNAHRPAPVPVPSTPSALSLGPSPSLALP